MQRLRKRDARWWARFVAATVVVGICLAFGIFAGLVGLAAARFRTVDPVLAFVMYDPVGGPLLYAVSFAIAALAVWRFRRQG